MSLNFDEKELEKELVKTIAELVKEGKLPTLSHQKVNEIVQGVKETLKNAPFEFSWNDLKNSKEELRLSCMAEYINPHLKKEQKIDYKFLFEEKDEAVLTKQIANLLKAVMHSQKTLKPELDKKNEAEEQQIDSKLDESAKEIAAQIMRNMKTKNEYKLGKNAETTNLVDSGLDQIKEGFRELYGVDPDGGLSAPVLSVRGNLSDMPNYAQEYGYDTFFMEKELKPIAELEAPVEEPQPPAPETPPPETKPEPDPLTKGLLDVVGQAVEMLPEISAKPVLDVIQNTAPTLKVH